MAVSGKPFGYPNISVASGLNSPLHAPIRTPTQNQRRSGTRYKKPQLRECLDGIRAVASKRFTEITKMDRRAGCRRKPLKRNCWAFSRLSRTVRACERACGLRSRLISDGTAPNMSFYLFLFAAHIKPRWKLFGWCRAAFCAASSFVARLRAEATCDVCAFYYFFRYTV